MSSPFGNVHFHPNLSQIKSQNSPRTKRGPQQNKENYYMYDGTDNIDRPFTKHISTTQVNQSESWQKTKNDNTMIKGNSNIDYDDCSKLSLDQINKELDQNINDLIFLLNRRRALVQVKRVKLCEEFNRKIVDISNCSVDQIFSELKQVDDSTIQRLIQDQNQLQKISKMLSDSTNQGGRKKIKEEELNRSHDFWNINKQIESEIDSLLQNLKNVDKEIINRNVDIKEECHKLDDLDDKIRELLINKTQDSLLRAEPIFQLKQKLQDQLNIRLKQQSQIKQDKIQKIAKIISLLNYLKEIREHRYASNRSILGQTNSDNDTNYENGFTIVIQNIETLSQMQEELINLEARENVTSNELDKQDKENQAIFTEIIKRSSQEARTFSDWGEDLRKRLRYHKILNYYSSIFSLSKTQHLDMTQIGKLYETQQIIRLKEEMVHLKPLSDENVSIKGGIIKTNETTKTFQEILNALANENKRRKELLVVLEQCSLLRHQEDQKTEQLRIIELDLIKKTQQKRHLQEDLENDLGDADLSTFKKIEGMLNGYDQDLQQLDTKRTQLRQELSNINQEVFQEIDVILHEYSDILNDILPVNWVATYDLKKTQHLKLIKTQLKKTLKRIGILD